jgi:hypothetical protein
MSTNENMAEEVAQDPISQGQANLDAQQEAVTSDMNGFTPAQLQQIGQVVQAQMGGVIGQVSGLQSKIDTGLNRIRSDSLAASRENVKQELDVLLQSQELDESQLQRLRQLRASEQQIEAQIGQYVMDAQNVQAQPQEVQDPLGGARVIAQQYGANPYDQRIDYAALQDSSLSEAQRLMRFTRSLEALGSNVSAPVASPPTPQQPGQSRTANPPVEPGPAQSTSFSNEDEVLNAYIAGNISSQERDQRLKSVGSELKFRK